MSNKRRSWLVYGLLLVAAFCFRVAIARFLPNDDPDDGRVYAQLARNLLEQHVYSDAAEAPYNPTLIRLPGYPLFLAGVYALFGHHNNTAVRIIQALIDTATCALIALVAYYWEPEERRKRASSIGALSLAAVCPFTTIYVATILTETLTMFLAVAMCLTATLALRASKQKQTILLWALTGVTAGLAVLFRPDSGLFAAALGITLVIAILFRRGSKPEQSGDTRNIWFGFSRALYTGTVFSVAFLLLLVPWTIRNHHIFHIFQPLAPAHAEMPGEFVPRGYHLWLRTWLHDERYIGPMLWSLDQLPIKLDDLPDEAFDSGEEKSRVAALLQKYNHPPQEQAQAVVPAPASSPTPVEQQAERQPAPSPEASPTEEESGQNEEGSGDESDESDSSDQNAATEEQQPVEMTPEIDAGFAQIARERIARSPLRYYLFLPAKRAAGLWFDTHSQYYPFEGQLLPVEDLDYDIHQQIWLPLFTALMWIYTLLGVGGGLFLWSSRDFYARCWLLLAGLMIFLRLGFFSTLENPEPRYVVEIFPFLSILGGIAASRIIESMRPSRRPV